MSLPYRAKDLVEESLERPVLSKKRKFKLYTQVFSRDIFKKCGYIFRIVYSRCFRSKGSKISQFHFHTAQKIQQKKAYKDQTRPEQKQKSKAIQHSTELAQKFTSQGLLFKTAWACYYLLADPASAHCGQYSSQTCLRFIDFCIYSLSQNYRSFLHCQTVLHYFLLLHGL